VWFSILPVKEFALLMVRLEADYPRPSGIYQRFIGWFVVKCSTDVKNIDLELLRKKLQQAPH
jgi:hypothetical protein